MTSLVAPAHKLQLQLQLYFSEIDKAGCPHYIAFCIMKLEM